MLRLAFRGALVLLLLCLVAVSGAYAWLRVYSVRVRYELDNPLSR